MLLCFIFTPFSFTKVQNKKNCEIKEFKKSLLDWKARQGTLSVARKRPAENGNGNKIMLGLQMRSKVVLKREFPV